MEMKSFSKIQYLKIDDLEAGQLQDVSWIAKSSFFYCEELCISLKTQGSSKIKEFSKRISIKLLNENFRELLLANIDIL